MPKSTPTYEKNPEKFYYPPGVTEPVLKTPEMLKNEGVADLDEDTDSTSGAEVVKEEPASKKGAVGTKRAARKVAVKK